jgi:hypothetical protein
VRQTVSRSSALPAFKPVRTEDIISDGRVPHPAERQHRPSLSGIPNSIRRDRAKLDAELRRQEIGAEDEVSDMMS